MMCCSRKRSPNDVLDDPSTAHPYCGTCWQLYLQQRTHPRPWEVDKTRESSVSAVAEDKVDEEETGIVADDDSLRPLDLVLHSDGQRYLISRSRKLVLDRVRLSSGHFRCVGEVFGDGKDELKLFKVSTVATTSKFPFSAVSEDHCETPKKAYEDLSPVLSFLATALGKTRATLQIWDPYYCAGSVKSRLGRLGFNSVRNDCVDFYSLVERNECPEHDVIVTNPPYSSKPVDHIEKLFRILATKSTPWLVLQPNYVYTKPYWEEITSKHLTAPRPFFLTPETPRQYKYRTPCGLRHLTHAQAMRTSPFSTFWYCWFGADLTRKFYTWFVSDEQDASRVPLSLACTEYFLPDSFKDSNDRTRRKKRKAAVDGRSGHEVLPGSGETCRKKGNNKRKKPRFDGSR